MITNIKFLEKYCTDYKNIENYEDAVRSPLIYDLHHRREISENKSRKDLKEENLYYGRPPEELIFLEHGEHMRLHKKGKFVSTDTRQKMSDARKGDKNPNFGKHLSAETRQKMSDALKGKQNALGHHCSEETRQRMSDAKKGEKCYMYGKPKSAETKQKISDARKGKHHSEETRAKLSEANKGRHWHLENGRRIYTD